MLIFDIILGPSFSYHIRSFSCRAILFPVLSVFFVIFRCRSELKNPSCDVRTMCCVLFVVISSVVFFVSSRATRRPSSVTSRAASLVVVGIVIVVSFFGIIVVVISRPAIMLPKARRISGFVWFLLISSSWVVDVWRGEFIWT